MKVACYFWAGASDEEDHPQKEGLFDSASEYGIDPAEVEWYCEEKASKRHRPAFDRLQRDIIEGKIKAALFWTLDHISHHPKDLAKTITSWCEQGIRVIVVTDKIELGGAASQAVAAVLRGLAKSDLDFHRKRQRAGIVAARKRGVYLGRKPGTTKGKPQEALALRGKGLTAAEIAEELGVSERTVFRYLGTSKGT